MLSLFPLPSLTTHSWIPNRVAIAMPKQQNKSYWTDITMANDWKQRVFLDNGKLLPSQYCLLRALADTFCDISHLSLPEAPEEIESSSMSPRSIEWSEPWLNQNAASTEWNYNDTIIIGAMTRIVMDLTISMKGLFQNPIKAPKAASTAEVKTAYSEWHLQYLSWESRPEEGGTFGLHELNLDTRQNPEVIPHSTTHPYPSVPNVFIRDSRPAGVLTIHVPTYHRWYHDWYPPPPLVFFPRDVQFVELG